MNHPIYLPSRRLFLGSVALSAAYFTTPGLFAEELTRTAAQTEGPFYPDKLPLDTDNDLIVINDTLTPAVGTITHLTGKILGPSGEPIRNAASLTDSRATAMPTGAWSRGPGRVRDRASIPCSRRFSCPAGGIRLRRCIARACATPRGRGAT